MARSGLEDATCHRAALSIPEGSGLAPSRSRLLVVSLISRRCVTPVESVHHRLDTDLDEEVDRLGREFHRGVDLGSFIRVEPGEDPEVIVGMDPTQRLLRACRREPVDRAPVWLMRQAGRFMASYQAVRKRVSFMELCRTPELACEVTMMPIDQLGVDSAILFSDILVPLEPMGVEVSFPAGPRVAPPVRTVADIDALRWDGVAEEVGYVYEAVRLIKSELNGRVPLLGFAGSPWTLASYLVEGGSSRNLHELKSLMYNEPEALERLLEKLSAVITDYLRRQIAAGADAVQIFDSWGGALAEPEWRRFSGRYTAMVMRDLADTGVPLIHYVNGGSHLLEATAELPCENNT